MDTEAFQWMSRLGASVALFIVYGGFYVLIGVIGPISLIFGDDDRIIFMGPAAAEARFGEQPSDLLAKTPHLREVRDTMLLALSSLMFVIGVLVVGITWFGLRNGQQWALHVLVGAALVPLGHYVLILIPYFRAATVGSVVMSIPPFITIPVLIALPALFLGWTGLR